MAGLPQAAGDGKQGAGGIGLLSIANHPVLGLGKEIRKPRKKISVMIIGNHSAGARTQLRASPGWGGARGTGPLTRRARAAARRLALQMGMLVAAACAGRGAPGSRDA